MSTGRTNRKSRRSRRPGRTAPTRHADRSDDALATAAGVASRAITATADGGQALRAAGVPIVTAALVATGAAGASATALPTVAAPSRTAAPGTSRTAAPAHPTYTVRSGDTLTGIAERVGSTVAVLARMNRLPEADHIRVGQVLQLPGIAPTRPRANGTAHSKAAHSKAAHGTTAQGKAAQGRRPQVLPDLVHVVRPGDTLTAIAARHKLTVRDLARANGIGPTGLIRPGQKLRLPGVHAPARRRAAAPTRPYTVRPGDSLGAICAAQKVSLTDVLRLNRLDRRAVIHPGQVLRLPGPAPVPNTFLGRRYPDSVARAAAANRATLARRAMPSRTQVRAMVVRTARSMGVDPALAQAIAWQESGFNPRVVSPANAIGTMQVIPGTGRWASTLVGRPLDLLDPHDNIVAGVAVIAALLASAEDKDAIAGYYQGLASVRSRGMYEDTKAYVASVNAHRKRFAAQAR